MKNMMLVLALVFSLLGNGFTQEAALQVQLAVPHVFGNHMVLQRQRDAAIWGTGRPGADVAVGFKGQQVTGKVDANGRWQVAIPTGQADANGAVLEIHSGSDSLEIQDVLVGEVWLASGQSNMVFTMNRAPAYQEIIAGSSNPLIRMFNAPQVTAATPQQDIDGTWSLCSPESVPTYSAVAFFFARKLQSELGIPIGVIKTAWGGKPVETFTSREALNSLPATKGMVEALLSSDAKYDDAQAQRAFQTQLDRWMAAAAQQKTKPAAERKALAKKPVAPKRPLETEGKPGVLFDSMIQPFVGYSLRGAIWYQGEANAKAGAVPYDLTLPLMIGDWRSRWNDDFSFYFVQLANYHQPSTEPGTPDDWALLQDRMRLVLNTTPKTGMAIINDVGEAKDIHPKNKQAPGERLALWALAKDYGRDMVYSGPLFKSSQVKQGAIRITFDQAGAGLKAREGGPLGRFEISGVDRVWHWADAKIVAPDSVLVSSPSVEAPVAVRYAWAANPQGANLVNSEGLPASVFRTDNWE